MQTVQATLNRQQDRQSRILIVDNDDRILSSLETVLRKQGFDTHTTWSGREALALIESRPFDVVLVDDHLPDLYYGEFLKRASRRAAQLRIIVMQAGRPLPAAVRRYKILGAAAVVDKTDPEQVRQLLTPRNHDTGLERTRETTIEKRSAKDQSRPA